MDIYYRDDYHTVNTEYARKLLDSNLSTGSSIQASYSSDITTYYYSDVYICHRDGSKTLLASGVAQTDRVSNGSGYQTGYWTPPLTSLDIYDAIYIREYAKIYNTQYHEFITQPLLCTELNNIQWTFTRYTAKGGSDPLWWARTYYSNSTSYNTRITGISVDTGLTDINLKYYKSGTKKIAATTVLDDMQLRIRKGSTTYGLPLVETTDTRSTGHRIYDGSNTKTLVEYT